MLWVKSCVMKFLPFSAILALSACGVGSDDGGDVWVVPAFQSTVAHTPGIYGYSQVKSEAVEFRKYRVHRPGGVWEVVLDAGDPPIVISPKGGKKVSLASEWYPEEGGADAAAVYGFTKGDETLIVLAGNQ